MLAEQLSLSSYRETREMYSPLFLFHTHTHAHDYVTAELGVRARVVRLRSDEAERAPSLLHLDRLALNLKAMHADRDNYSKGESWRLEIKFYKQQKRCYVQARI